MQELFDGQEDALVPQTGTELRDVGRVQTGGLQCLSVRKDAARRAFGHHAALGHDDDPLKTFGHKIHIVQNGQHQLAALRQGADNLGDAAAAAHILGR